MRYGFLGPETTFTHQALLQATDGILGPEDDLRAYPSVAAAMGDLVAGDIDAMMAPIENSVEGGVSGTLDVLAATVGIGIVAEQIVPISFVLAARTHTALEDVTSVLTHTHAHAQCQRFVRQSLPHAVPLPALSTAAAAKDVSSLDLDDPRAHSSAAICSALAASHYGLVTIASGIEDNIGAQTRFVLVQRDGRIPARTGADKTTIVATLAHDRAGSLRDMLEVFNSNGVNLTRIESRPTGDSLGRYSFSIDLEGHIEDRRVAAALRALHRICTSLVFLGSYPSIQRTAAIVDEHNSDDAYDDAREWIDTLLTHVRPQAQ